jgi:hypothetical protein
MEGTLQTQVPGESLGRVTAWDWMGSLALWPAGPAVAGPLAQALGVPSWCGWAAGSVWVMLVGNARRSRTASTLTG